MTEQEHANHATEKVALEYKHANNVREKGVLLKCIKWGQACISKFNKHAKFVKERARQ